MAPVDALPTPGNALHLVVLGQPGFPQVAKHVGRLPLQKALVHGAGTAKALSGQRLPLASCARCRWEIDPRNWQWCRLSLDESRNALRPELHR